MTTPNTVLRQILEVTSAADWQDTVAPWLESSLTEGGRIRVEYVDLRPFDMLNVRLSEPFVDGREARILVSEKAQGLPYLAILCRGVDEQWQLRSFESQCPACFGTGVLGDHPEWDVCGSCGGTGWGGRY